MTTFLQIKALISDITERSLSTAILVGSALEEKGGSNASPTTGNALLRHYAGIIGINPALWIWRFRLEEAIRSSGPRLAQISRPFARARTVDGFHRGWSGGANVVTTDNIID
jgi:hypothetical protein